MAGMIGFEKAMEGGFQGFYDWNMYVRNCSRSSELEKYFFILLLFSKLCAIDLRHIDLNFHFIFWETMFQGLQIS